MWTGNKENTLQKENELSKKSSMLQMLENGQAQVPPIQAFRLSTICTIQ